MGAKPSARDVLGQIDQAYGRRERIRTSGPYVPNVVLYQAELLSDKPGGGQGPPRGSALIAMPPWPRNQPKARKSGPFAALKGHFRLYMVPALTTAWGVAKW
jgi:hypothetical protein